MVVVGVRTILLFLYGIFATYSIYKLTETLYFVYTGIQPPSLESEWLKVIDWLLLFFVVCMVVKCVSFVYSIQ